MALVTRRDELTSIPSVVHQVWGNKEVGDMTHVPPEPLGSGWANAGDCYLLSMPTVWASGCGKPLTPHGGWWTRGSPRYLVLCLRPPTLTTSEERRAA